MQILINMVSNAAKFTDSGFVKVFVDFVSGSEIKSEDLRSKYFSAANENIENQADEDEINEKPRKIFEQLTLQKKYFELEQRFLVNRHIEGTKLEQSMKNNGQVEIVTSKHRDRSLTPSPLKMRFNSPTNFGEGYIRFEIIDSGCGMNKADIDASFGKFQQVNASSSKRQIGTGLGLWITKEIVELMQGKIEVHSQLKQGTSVVIMLKSKSVNPPSPLEYDREKRSSFQSKTYATIENKEAYFECQQQQQYQEHGAMINSHINQVIVVQTALVVEDIPYNQEVNKKFLEKCGVQDISIANNGQEAANIFLKAGPNYFDLILMDIDMPVMDGKAAVKIIRREEKARCWKPANIVFLTAFAESRTQQELLDPQGEYRANGFYSKPASLETIRRLLKGIPLTSSTSLPQYRSEKAVSKILSNEFNTIPQKSVRVALEGIDQKFILIADDDSFNLSMITKMVKLCGFEALEARNGKEAVQIFAEHWKSIKFVLMDCEMPILNGLEATSKIMESQKGLSWKSGRKIPIYGLTGHVGTDYRQKCLESGMEDVLEKPMKLDELKALLYKDSSKNTPILNK